MPARFGNRAGGRPWLSIEYNAGRLGKATGMKRRTIILVGVIAMAAAVL
jgi:hypothetical protein